MKNLNERFKNVRRLLNKSQEQLAADLGVSKQAISNIENKKSLPSVALLCKLTIDYKISANYILAGFGEVFIDEIQSNKNLKHTIIAEVEKYLEDRGIV